MGKIGSHYFIEQLRKHSELITTDIGINPALEITEITDRISKQRGGGKAMLFTNTGTGFPVLINSLGSLNRMKIVFRGKSPDTLAGSIDKIARDVTSSRSGLLSKIKMIPKLRQFGSLMPRKIKRKGICQEVIMDKPDLDKIPVLKCWPHDGGRFITLPLVHTIDPETGSRNLGMYRMQVLDRETTGMHWHMHKTGARHYRGYQKAGRKMPVAVALGGDPVYTYCATAPLPDGIDEYLLAGYIRQKPVKLVKCISQDLWVPDDADIIIEGYVDPSEDLVLEGPFGDHTGFYSLADYYPKFHVTCITHRKNAVYPATIVGIPPQEDAWIALATEKLFLPPMKLSMIPELEDMHMPEPGVAHNIAVFSINQDYPGQGKKVLNSIWGAGQMMFNKFAIVLGTHVNIRDYRAMAKEVCRRVDPARDLFFTEGPMDVLDHSAREFAFGGKLGFDATGEGREFSVPAESEILDSMASFRNIHPEIRDVNTSLLNDSIPIIIISLRKSRRGHIHELATDLKVHFRKELIENIPFWLFVDEKVNVNDLYQVAWIAGNHTDPGRDAWVERIGNSQGKAVLFIDSSRKTKEYDGFERNWPNPVIMDRKTIDRIDRLWPSLKLGPFIHSPSDYYRTLEEAGDAVVNE